MPRSRSETLRLIGIDTWTLRTPPETVAAPESGAMPAPVEAPSAPPVIAPAPVVPAAQRMPAVTGVASAAPAGAVAAEPLPSDWDGLRERVAACEACGLCDKRTQTVFGTGQTDAPLMVVGEGPGADEDAQGEPFVGRAGKLLDEMLGAIGHSRQRNVYIANVVKCRPPGNRDPMPAEAEACRPFLEQQIRLVRPKLIVALGRVAAQRLLATDQPLARLRGPLHRYGEFETPLLITYHPAYLLRSPREKAKSWDDLKKIYRQLQDERAA